MKVDNASMQNFEQEVIGNSLVFQSQSVSKNVENDSSSLLQQSEQLAKQLQNLMDQIQVETDNDLGDEKETYEVLEHLNQMKNSISDLLGIKEMDSSEIISSMNSQLQQMSNRMFELESRTIGSQIKDEVKSMVNNTLDSAKTVVSESSKSVMNFLKNAKESVNNVFSNVKQAVIDFSKSWKEYVSTYHDCLSIASSSNTPEKTRNAENKKNDYLQAELDSKYEIALENYNNSRGLTKLNYKTEMNYIEVTKARLDQTNRIDNLFFDMDDKFKEKSDSMKQTIAETKENIGLYVQTGKNEISKSASNLRNAAVTKAFSSLDAAMQAVSKYMIEKKIPLPEKNLQEVQELQSQDLSKEDGLERT